MDCGGIYLFDDINENLELIVHSGFKNDFVDGLLSYDKTSKNVIMVKKGKPFYTLISELDASLTRTQQLEGLRAFASVPLLDNSNVIGCINVASQIHYEFSISSRIALETVAAQIGNVIARLQTTKALQESEEHLRSKTNKLEEINTALNVLLEKREEDKILLQEQVLSNVKRLALPYVEKLKKGKLTEIQIALLDILESSLHEIISPFSLKLSSNSFGLTPSEIKVADLIRQGKGTKEIAAIRNLSDKTVGRHRENIRNKLGIKNKKTNLQSHLNSLA
jgi:DNA-binding CsgD family transcriptional regulator/signal transduction protein with GAF and PtsI domain